MSGPRVESHGGPAREPPLPIVTYFNRREPLSRASGCAIKAAMWRKSSRERPGWLFLLAMGVVVCVSSAQAEHRMIPIGDRRISVYCDGPAGRSPTVILIPAGGSTAKDWVQVQPALSDSLRVCSYDHAGHGESDKAPTPVQSVDEVVDDLHAWMQQDLARRSTHGEFRLAEKNGHFIQRDQPDMVIQAVRDVVRQVETMGR